MSTHFLLVLGRQLGATGSTVCGFRDVIDCSWFSGGYSTQVFVCAPKRMRVTQFPGGKHVHLLRIIQNCLVLDVDTTLNFAWGLGQHKGLVL